MTTQELIDEMKFELTGGLLELEIDDTQLERAIQKALRELERYWDETEIINVPFASCIDYSTCESFKDRVNTIVKIYRTAGVGNIDQEAQTGQSIIVGDGHAGSTMMDPLYMQQWMVFSNAGSMYNLQDYVLNYAAWNTMSQLRNTLSTELSFEQDKLRDKLYINTTLTAASVVAVKYIPKLKRAEDVKSEYWLDILIRLSTDYAKIALGRIRTRFTQSNALWTQDGDKILEEGMSDLKELREVLRANANLVYIID